MIEQVDVPDNPPRRRLRPAQAPTVAQRRRQRKHTIAMCQERSTLESPMMIKQALADAVSGDQEALAFLEVCAPDQLEDESISMLDPQLELAEALDWWAAIDCRNRKLRRRMIQWA